MRWLAIAMTTAAVIAGAGPARAQPAKQPPVPRERPSKPERPLIGVLELAPSSEATAIYTVPVADALAKRLRKIGWRVERLTLDDAAVPTRFALIVRGRIVEAANGAVKLEVRVQDPERGIDAGGLSSSEKPLTEIDTLTAELAKGLDALLGRARDDRARRVAEERAVRAGPVVLPEAVVEGRAPPRDAREERPRMVVFTATGDARDLSGSQRVPVLQVTRALYALADRLGFQPVATAEAGVIAAERARAEIARAGASWGLMVHVARIDFDWVGVLAARGRARVALVDAQGTTRYSVTVRTDTVVGSRGDGYPALVRFVGAQLADIVEPQLRRLLGGETP